MRRGRQPFARNYTNYAGRLVSRYRAGQASRQAQIRAGRRRPNIGPLLPGGAFRSQPVPETKYVDYVNISLAPTSAGAIYSVALNGVSQGPAQWQRIASRIHMTSLYVRGYFVRNGVGAPTTDPTRVRVLLVYDKQANGAAPGNLDVINTREPTAGAAGVAAQQFLAGMNMDNRDRFVILRDKIVTLPPIANAAPFWTSPFPLPGQLEFIEFVKLKKLEAHYKGATSGSGDIATGSLQLMVLSDVAPCPYSLAFTARLKYLDV